MMHFKEVACLFAFYLIFNVGAIEDHFNNETDTRAKPGQFPYQVSLQRLNQHICGASILSNSWVLTAAHCVENHKNASAYSILAGTTSLSKGGVRHSIKRILRHPLYYKYTFDIALIKLKKRLKFNRRINKINLPEHSTKSGTRVVLTGWGLTNYTPKVSTSNLHYVYVTTITNLECKIFYGLLVTSCNICTSTKSGKGSCKGDSGGPLVDPKTNSQVGIVSGGIPCAVGKPDIFTRIHEYTPWIKLALMF